MEYKNIADKINDTRIIVGAVFTVLGIIVWVAISWTSLLNRVGAVEQTTEQQTQTFQNISTQLNDLKTQQAVIGAQITGIESKSTDTNILVRRLLELFRPK